MKQLLFLLLTLNCDAQAPVIQWVKVLGGTGSEVAARIIQTTDGGSVTTGYSDSSDGDVPGTRIASRPDLWIIKHDAQGTLQWQTTLGGSYSEFTGGIVQTADGGYAVTGTTFSNDGDITMQHGGCDFWVVKLNASGTLLWQNTYGGSSTDYANDIKQTTDGGFIIAGATTSADGQAAGYHGGNGWDFWVIKIDAAGILEWQKTLGGTDDDQAAAVVQAADGGYLAAGYAISGDGDITNLGSCYDAWLVKLDTNGNLQWQKTYDTGNCEKFNGLIPTTDGGYILAGNKGYDAWALKTDVDGIVQWQRSVGGMSIDEFNSVLQTPDGGYILGGNSISTDGDLAGVTGHGDAWLVKLDADGQIAWQKKAGGTGDDYGYGVAATADGGYLLCGTTTSIDEDFTGNHGGYEDMFIAKFIPENLSANTVTNNLRLVIYPNPVSSTLTLQLGNETIDKITITDLTGKMLVEQAALTLQIDVQNLAAGIYMLDALSAGNHYRKQFIKQ